MKPQLTQAELSQIHDDGNLIVAFRKAYCVRYLRGRLFYLQQVSQTRGIPYTGKGRFHVISPENFDSMQRREA